MKYGLIRKGPGKNSKILIYTVSLFAIILWGISYIWTNTLISLDIPVTYFVFVRILLAGFVLFLLNAASGRIAKIKKKDIPKFLLLAFFEPFIYFICESYGVKETGSPTLSAMIIATIPIFSVGAGILFFKEKNQCGEYFRYSALPYRYHTRGNEQGRTRETLHFRNNPAADSGYQ